MSQIAQSSFFWPVQTLTGDVGGAVGSAAGNINLLGTAGTITVTGNPVTHTLTISAGASIPTTFHSDAGDATPALNTLTISGGTNIGTSGAGSTVTVNLDPKITLLDTDAGDTQGSITIGTCKWHTYGTSNLFMGENSGNLTLTGVYNVGISDFTLNDLTTGFNNTAVNFGSLGTLTTGDHNCAIGYTSGADFTTGGKNSLYGAFSGATLKTSSSYNTALGAWSLMDLTLTDRILNYNIAIGYLSGTGITADNSNSNILISSDGANESNTLRIGRQGNGNNQINKAYIAGIYNTAVGATAGVAIVDSSHQIGTLSGTTGQVLQGGTKPAWSTATYPSTAAIGDVLVASAANVVGVVSGAATAGYLLTANGAGTAPTFQAPPAGVTYASDAETLAGTVTNKAVAPSNLKAKLGLQTLHALPVGNSDSLALDWLAVGADGTVLIGNSGADPSFSANPTVSTIYATTFDTNVAAAGVALSGTTLSADGTDADIDINITAKGTGVVVINELELDTALAVSEGGTGLTTLGEHSLLVGDGTSPITSLTVGATGEILTGVSTADPTWLAAGDAGKVLTAHGAGSAVTWETPSGGSLSVNNQTDSYTLVLGDANKMITMTAAGANTLTVPKDATVNFAVGTQILVYQGGAGVTTIAPEDAGITIRSAGGLMNLYAQYSTCGLVKIAANLWVLAGDLA